VLIDKNILEKNSSQERNGTYFYYRKRVDISPEIYSTFHSLNKGGYSLTKHYRTPCSTVLSERVIAFCTTQKLG
jgi:hypothetical protein